MKLTVGVSGTKMSIKLEGNETLLVQNAPIAAVHV